MSLRGSLIVAGMVLAGLGYSTMAADWPQYRGPNFDGISTEKADPQWKGAGPKVVWRVPTPTGFSSFSVAGGKAFTQIVRGGRELCVALDAATGREVWACDVGEGKYPGGGDAGSPDNKGGDGPRSTPTVCDGRVYVLTPDIVLHCMDAATGKATWTRDLAKDHAAVNIQWKCAASPVIDGDLVFVAGGGPGQALLALDRKTGATVWKTGTETMTHATPTVATILGARQVIFFVKSGLVALSVKDGRELWRFEFPFKVSTASSPVVSGDVVYCSAGYGVGGGACRISRAGAGFKAAKMWMTPGDKDVANHWSTPVVKDGCLYGMFSFKQFGNGPVKCVDLATGAIKWSKPGFGPGNVTLVGDKLIALSDTGEVVVIAAQPAACKELARFKAVGGKCWSTPTFADGKIYVRSTKEGVCLDPAAH